MNIPTIDRGGPDEPVCLCFKNNSGLYCKECGAQICDCKDHECGPHTSVDIWKCDSIGICYTHQHTYCEHYPCLCGAGTKK